MGLRESLQQLFSATRETKEHFAAIDSAAGAADEPFSFEAVDKFASGVVQNLQPFGQKTYRGFLPASQTFDCEEGLVLLRLDAGCASCLLAEIQKAADLVAKFRKICKSNTASSRAPHVADYYIVLRY